MARFFIGTVAIRLSNVLESQPRSVQGLHVAPGAHVPMYLKGFSMLCSPFKTASITWFDQSLTFFELYWKSLRFISIADLMICSTSSAIKVSSSMLSFMEAAGVRRRGAQPKAPFHFSLEIQAN